MDLNQSPADHAVGLRGSSAKDSDGGSDGVSTADGAETNANTLSWLFSSGDGAFTGCVLELIAVQDQEPDGDAAQGQHQEDG